MAFIFADLRTGGAAQFAQLIGPAGVTFSVSAPGTPSTLAIGAASFTFSTPSAFAVAAPGQASSLIIGGAAFTFQFGDTMEPVTVEEAKVSARFSGTELDDDIAGIIVAARKEAEHLTSRVYRRRSFAFELDAWPGADQRFEVFEPDACSISYFNELRAWSNLDPAAFEFAPIGSGAEIAPALDTYWPALGRRAVGARVRVTFTAGPASRADVDERVKLYIKAVVAAWVNNPDAVQSKSLSISPLFERLLDGLKVYG